MLLAGCGTVPGGAERAREVVLEYVGGSVGTAGPFSNKAFPELNSLSASDRTKAGALIDRGALAFVVISAGKSTRIVLVQGGKVVGDLSAASSQP